MRSDAEACQNLLGICVKPAESLRKSAKTRIPRHIEAHARKDRMNICEAKLLHMPLAALKKRDRRLHADPVRTKARYHFRNLNGLRFRLALACAKAGVATEACVRV